MYTQVKHAGDVLTLRVCCAEASCSRAFRARDSAKAAADAAASACASAAEAMSRPGWNPENNWVKNYKFGINTPLACQACKFAITLN